MEKITKKNLTELNDYILNDIGFICFASFESRCLSIPKNIDKNKIKKIWILRNNYGRTAETNKENFYELKREYSDSYSIEFSLKRPDMIADLTFNIIEEIKENSIKRLVVDISTFTHEVLLILLRAIFLSKYYFESVVLLYNGAEKYEDWLSKGCKDVRNVMGYPGYWNPDYKYHLILMSGFEIERATGLVEMLEPDSLSLGIGIDYINENHQKSTEEYQKKFEEWIKNLQIIKTYDTFEFSCFYIEKTIDILENLIKSDKEKNYILVPLNTKLSTIAAGIVALNNDSIQVCYSIPEAYNIKYAIPSQNVTIVDLLNINGF